MYILLISFSAGSVILFPCDVVSGHKVEENMAESFSLKSILLFTQMTKSGFLWPVRRFFVFCWRYVEFGLEGAAEVAWRFKAAHSLYLAHCHVGILEQVFCSCQFSLAYVVCGVCTRNVVYPAVLRRIL